MFKDVLSIGGKPGLFKMVSHAKNYIIVESLIDGKRTPSYQNEKISLLRDIVMYGNSGEKRLNELFKAAFELEDGKKIEIDIKNKEIIGRLEGNTFIFDLFNGNLIDIKFKE